MLAWTHDESLLWLDILYTDVVIWELLQTEFRYVFRKGPRQISAGTVFRL